MDDTVVKNAIQKQRQIKFNVLVSVVTILLPQFGSVACVCPDENWIQLLSQSGDGLTQVRFSPVSWTVFAQSTDWWEEEHKIVVISLKGPKFETFYLGHFCKNLEAACVAGGNKNWQDEWRLLQSFKIVPYFHYLKNNFANNQFKWIFIELIELIIAKFCIIRSRNKFIIFYFYRNIRRWVICGWKNLKLIN